MAYRLDPAEPTGDEVRRVVVERLGDARHRLDGLADADPAYIEEQVHQVRKRCKELRGLARLVRPALGDEYQRFDRRVEAAADELASIRDAHAVLATFENLQTVSGSQADDRLERVHSARAAVAEQATKTLVADVEGVARADRLLAKAERRLDRWAIRPGFVDLAEGFEKTYRKGRRRLRTARLESNDEAVHQWRIAVKHLWYQIRLLRPAAPSVLGPFEERLDDLADALGDDHDLAVLIDRLTAAPDLGEAETRAARKLARQQQRRLRERAFRLGATLYAERPRRLTARVASYWDLTATLGTELATGGIVSLAETDDDIAAPASLVERERKFVLDETPRLPDDGRQLRQGYLAVDGTVSVRVREADGDDHSLTVKSGVGPVRTELEWPIDRARFDAVWDLTAGRRIVKTRYQLIERGRPIDIDVFADDLAGLVLAEVEFDDNATMTAYVPPAWFGREVTDDPTYTNASLALADPR